MASLADSFETRLRVWFNEKGDRTGVTEELSRSPFGPFMQLGGRKLMLNLLNGGGASLKLIVR